MDEPVFKIHAEIDEDHHVSVEMIGAYKRLAVPCLTYITQAVADMLDCDPENILNAVKMVPIRGVKETKRTVIDFAKVEEIVRKMRGNGQDEEGSADDET